MNEKKIKIELTKLAISNPEAISDIVKDSPKDTNNLMCVLHNKYLIYLNPVGSGNNSFIAWTLEEFCFAKQECEKLINFI